MKLLHSIAYDYGFVYRLDFGDSKGEWFSLPYLDFTLSRGEITARRLSRVKRPYLVASAPRNLLGNSSRAGVKFAGPS